MCVHVRVRVCVRVCVRVWCVCVRVCVRICVWVGVWTWRRECRYNLMACHRVSMFPANSRRAIPSVPGAAVCSVYSKAHLVGNMPIVTTCCGTGPVIFTQLLVALNDRGMYERAWKLFDHMRINHCEPDEVAFTAMISGKCVFVSRPCGVCLWLVRARSWVCFLLSIAQATPAKGDTITACVCTAPAGPFWTTRVIVARGQ